MRSSTRARLADALGVLWVLGAAAAVMAPALVHGASLGPFDLLSRYGLTARPGVSVHSIQATDQIGEIIPWSALAWTQVHAGHLPLWDPYNALGMPLAFNWQSGAFSAPALVSYLVPLHLAYTVQVLVILAVAGTGAYVACRIMRIGVLGAALAATVYELSGPFMGFLGWPIAGVLSWTGWLVAATVVVVRGRHRALGIAGLAVALAGAVYAGQPDALVVLGPALAVFAVVLLVVRTRRARGPAHVWRAVGDLAVAGVAGAALSAPLLLPGFQLVLGSVFIHAPKTSGSLPAQSLVSTMLPGYSATSRARNQWFDIGAADYLGAIALVLAVVGLAMRRRRATVLAVTASGVVMFLLSFGPGISALLNTLPFRARWHLAVVLLGFAVAVLAGEGADALIVSARQSTVRAWLLAGFGVAAVGLAGLRVVGIGALSPAAAGVRSHSFYWPAVEIAVGLAVVGVLVARRDRPSRRLRWWAAAALLACETASLAAVGASVWSSSPVFAPTTPALTQLARAVGPAVVGFGSPSCELPPTVGLLPESNSLYGVHELSAYNPVTPLDYFRALRAKRTVPVSAFCPVITSATEARRYGVGFVLVRHGARSPTGTVFVRVVDDEDLYRVPGAAQATVTAIASGSHRPPPVDALGVPVPVTHPDPATWRVQTATAAPGVLRLHLTDVPGWHATIDGRAVALTRYGSVMLQVHIPAGHHVVELHYLPESFVVGVALAAAAALGLIVMLVVAALRHRRAPRAV